MAEPNSSQDEKQVGVLTQEDKRDLNMAVLTKKTNVMDPVEYAQIKKIAGDMMQSGALAKSFANTDQVLMALMAGREMGMSFNEAVNDLYFVNGKLNIHGKATPAAIRRHHWQIKYKDETPDSCTASIKNMKTGEEIEDTFTFKEAEESGFTKDSSGKVKAGWLPGANRRRKLRYGVLSLIIHTYIPEVVGAVAGIGEYTEDYIEGEAVVTSSKPATPDRKAMMAAAEQEHQEAKAAEFVPKPVQTK